ncbi:MAG: methionine gamma-lyase [Hadesarchaea archaeon]|nr:MAG: methionine gamma-lyase [Hadesarchaea archaeon]TDA34435.1 MAG: methionine gamma-lyase [Hadesarchaea archaeon]
MERKGFATKAVHGGEEPCPLTGAHVVPIYQTSTFVLGKELPPRYVYTRHGNPTQEVLEKKMALLEGGEAALATASGMAAILVSLLALAEKGKKMACSLAVYGGTYNLMRNLLPRLGMEVQMFDPRKREEVEGVLREGAKILFLETPTNPTLDLVDLREVSDLAEEKGAEVVVDNTFMTPYYQRPLELGAKVVVYSATKYLCGHGDALGGIVVGERELVEEARKMLVLTGGAISPFNAWLIVRGLKTLPLRMEKHSQNALKVAEFLSSHPKVKGVKYPGLPSHPQHELARRQMKGFGGMLAFELGGMEEVYRMMGRLELVRCAVSLGDVSSLIEHPASMTHRSLPQGERERIGIGEGLVRMSVGVEDAEDIIGDLEKALGFG